MGVAEGVLVEEPVAGPSSLPTPTPTHPPSPWPDGDAAEVAAGCAASLGDKRREAEPKEVGEANKWTGAVEKCD